MDKLRSRQRAPAQHHQRAVLELSRSKAGCRWCWPGPDRQASSTTSCPCHDRARAKHLHPACRSGVCRWGCWGSDRLAPGLCSVHDQRHQVHQETGGVILRAGVVDEQTDSACCCASRWKTAASALNEVLSVVSPPSRAGRQQHHPQVRRHRPGAGHHPASGQTRGRQRWCQQ